MIPWKEYINSNILDFRKSFEKLPDEDRELIKKGEGYFSFSLHKPCQIVVINFETYPDYFIILHSKKHPDLDTEVLENVAFEDFSSQSLKEIELLNWLSLKEIRIIARSITVSAPRDLGEASPVAFQSPLIGKAQLFMYKKDIRAADRPDEFSFWLNTFINHELKTGLRKEQRQKIEETVDSLKEDAQAIPETVELRNKILENTQRLDHQIKELNKKVDGDIRALRKLVGTSEEFLDWKAFSTDVRLLKETHITKDTFDVHIKRLDEKIDKGLESLNTRIEDLKAIKFWSKRTLLEIALAIMAVIATLYGAGVIKF